MDQRVKSKNREPFKMKQWFQPQMSGPGTRVEAMEMERKELFWRLCQGDKSALRLAKGEVRMMPQFLYKQLGGWGPFMEAGTIGEAQCGSGVQIPMS